MIQIPQSDLQKIIDSLDANLQFVSELLQADIRLFLKRGDEIFIHNYFHPNQDSLYLGPRIADQHAGEKLKEHKDISVTKAFRLGRAIIGQFGLVINNRRIQEFAYPIFYQDIQEPVAVIAVERDIYTTQNTLGHHWDLIADLLVKALQRKISNDTKFPRIAFGEGAVLIKETQGQDAKLQKIIEFANPLAANLLAELAEHATHLVGRSYEDLFGNFQVKPKSDNKHGSIERVEEITLRQRTVILRHVRISEDVMVVLIKDNSEVKIKETLLKEIHHRVKNNLQTIVSLLRLQKRRNPELEEAFSEAINRTNSIALVHEHLARSNDIENVDFGHLVQTILKGLLASFGADHITVNFDCPKKVYILSEDATNLALVVNEILTNTLEHTIDNLTKIDIKLFAENGTLNIILEDDGGGFKESFDYRESTGLGWEIIRTIAEESLRGQLKVENIDFDKRKGLRVSLLIPQIVAS